MNSPPYRTIVLWFLLPSAAIFILYSPALGWPYFWDDLTIITLVRSHSYAELLTETVLGRYRPFDRALIKALDHFLGPQGAVFGHFIALATSALNATLVAQLGRRLCSPRVGVLAGLLFAAYPLSYQAVTQIAGLAHPIGLLLTLISVHSYIYFRHTGRWRWFLMTCLMVAAAPLTVETGVVAGALVVLSEIHLWFQHVPARRSTPWQSLLPLTVSLLASIWLLLVTRTQLSPNLPDLLKNANYFLQGATSPVSSAARILVSGGWNEQWAVFVLGAPTVLFLLLVLLRTSQRNSILFGLGWVLVTVIVPWWTLPYDYVMNSPRVLYLPSVGVGLIWANAITAAWNRTHLRWLSGSALIAMLLFGVSVIRDNLRLYETGLPPLADLARSAAGRPDDHLLVVNLPGWLSWPDLYYVMGHEGAMLMALETSSLELARYNAPRAAKVGSVSFSNVMEETPYYVGLYGEALDWDGLAMAIRAVDDVYLTHYGSAQATLEHVGRVTLGTQSDYFANFDHRVWLTAAETSLLGDVIQAQLRWHLVRKTEDYEIFVHALDCDGTVLGLKDGAALGRMYPPWQWKPGEIIVDVRHIKLESSEDGRCFRLEVGLFNTATGARMPVVNSQGIAFVNHVVPVYPD